MKKRILGFVITMALLLITTPTFASASQSTTWGTCHKAYITSATLQNTTGGWTSFEFLPYNSNKTIQYFDTGSIPIPMYNGQTYAYARPQGEDGTLYGTAFKVYRYHLTTWTPNNSGSNASTAKFKVYNAIYAENNSITTTTMTILQSMPAVIRGIY